MPWSSYYTIAISFILKYILYTRSHVLFSLLQKVSILLLNALKNFKSTRSLSHSFGFLERCLNSECSVPVCVGLCFGLCVGL